MHMSKYLRPHMSARLPTCMMWHRRYSPGGRTSRTRYGRSYLGRSSASCSTTRGPWWSGSMWSRKSWTPSCWSCQRQATKRIGRKHKSFFFKRNDCRQIYVQPGCWTFSIGLLIPAACTPTWGECEGCGDIHTSGLHRYHTVKTSLSGWSCWQCSTAVQRSRSILQ